MLFLWPFDAGVRKAAKHYLISLLKNPFRFFKGTYYQAIVFIQPVDFFKGGEQSMCDGCPDVTVHNNQLVWSCRLEERKQFGTILRTVPKTDGLLKEVQ